MTAAGFKDDADAAGWKFAATGHARFPDDTKPCLDCGQPTYLRDPSGKPRHRIDCDPRSAHVPTSQGANA